tara:strand:- start:674 stop:1549 length:876 start_codon:yes stop_codon:yes gene_type:complete
MNRIIFYSIKKLTLLLVVIFLVSSCSTVENDDFAEQTKIALRDVGNKLLLSNKDSISLILPVIELSPNKYQLSFNNSLSFEPSMLVTIMQQSFAIAKLPEQYRVEVVQCSNREVAYSYQMSADNESTIIPCAGRYLPMTCYVIEVRFTNRVIGFAKQEILLFTIVLLVVFGIVFFVVKKRKLETTKSENSDSEKLGSFYFYPLQNKLVKEAQEIALSKKECELLALFVANPNQIIKRDELTKRVWEDNGVFVGRSLDTYISKLRKKLKADSSIKLTNVHGVGYKLEIDVAH